MAVGGCVRFRMSGCSARWVIMAPCAAAGVLVVAGAWPTYSWGGVEAVIAMAMAVVVVTAIAGITGAAGVRRMTRAEPADRLSAGLRTGLQRFGLTLAAAAVLPWIAAVENRWYLVWLAIAYVVVSKFETLALVGWLRALEKRAC